MHCLIKYPKFAIAVETGALNSTCLVIDMHFLPFTFCVTRKLYTKKCPTVLCIPLLANWLLKVAQVCELKMSFFHYYC